jgi:hypothetical protein
MTYFANAGVPRFMKKFFSMCSTAGFITPSMSIANISGSLPTMTSIFIPSYAERFDELNSLFDFVHVWYFSHFLVSPVILFAPAETFLHDFVRLVVIESELHDERFGRCPFNGLIVG